MKKLIVFALFLNAFLLAGRFWQELDVHAQEETCTTTKGDVNGDDLLDASDAIAILAHLFLGTAEPVPVCETQRVVEKVVYRYLKKRRRLPLRGNCSKRPAIAPRLPCRLES